MIHIVALLTAGPGGFPNETAFSAYRNDPRVTALASERANAIAETVAYVSKRFVDYPKL